MIVHLISPELSGNRKSHETKNQQTVQAHLDLKGTVLHPIHWATFNLALHPWYEPMVRLTAAANFKKVKIATPVVGETTVYSRNISSARWWEQAMELSGGVINTAVIEREIEHE